MSETVRLVNISWMKAAATNMSAFVCRHDSVVIHLFYSLCMLCMCLCTPPASCCVCPAVLLHVLYNPHLHTHTHPLSIFLAILTSLSHWPPFGKIFILLCRSFKLCALYYKSGSRPCVYERSAAHHHSGHLCLIITSLFICKFCLMYFLINFYNAHFLINRRTQFPKQCGANDSFSLFLAADGKEKELFFEMIFRVHIFYTNQEKSSLGEKKQQIMIIRYLYCCS